MLLTVCTTCWWDSQVVLHLGVLDDRIPLHITYVQEKTCSHFPIDILGQVWCLIVTIPDLCHLSYCDWKMMCQALSQHDWTLLTGTNSSGTNNNSYSEHFQIACIYMLFHVLTCEGGYKTKRPAWCYYSRRQCEAKVSLMECQIWTSYMGKYARRWRYEPYIQIVIRFGFCLCLQNDIGNPKSPLLYTQ